jgi:hypothetical protein
MSDFIDPEELPFTADELFQAACLFMSNDAHERWLVSSRILAQA